MARDDLAPEGSYSASAISDYDLCRRIWAFRKIEGLPKPTKPSTEFGNAVHEQNEKWLKFGIPFDLTTEAGECALPALHYLPKPGTPGMQVEEPFLLEAWGYKFFGYKDIEITAGPVPVVWDHKTSSNPSKWGLTEKTLPDNIQAALYAAHAMVKAGSNEADLVWSYLKSTRPYRATPIRVRVTRERIEPTLGKIRSLVTEMDLVRKSGLRALDLPPTPGACEAYGGCAYRAMCNLTPQDRITAIMSTGVSEADKAALYAKLSAKQNNGAGTAINPPGDVPPPPPVAPQLSEDGKWQLVNGAWVAYTPPPVAPPARGRGRPAGSKNKRANSSDASASPDTGSGMSTARSMLVSALRTISEGFAGVAESIELGALDSDDD